MVTEVTAAGAGGRAGTTFARVVAEVVAGAAATGVAVTGTSAPKDAARTARRRRGTVEYRRMSKTA